MSTIEKKYHELTELERFHDRLAKRIAREELTVAWHTLLHEETGIELPWTGREETVYCNQGEYKDVDGESKYVVDAEATQLFIAKVIKFATKCGYAVVKPMKVDDDEFKAVITISTEPEVKVTYRADRRIVCTPNVIGKETKPAVFEPAKMTPATTVDVVEWTCEKISFLAMDTDDNSE